MKNKFMLGIALLGVLVTFAGCQLSLGGQAAPAALTILSTTTPDPANLNTAYQGMGVVVGFYTDNQCTQQAASLTVDISQKCFGWTRSAAQSKTKDTSVTDIQCYTDRLCLTEHTNTLACDAQSPAPTSREYRTDQCVQQSAKVFVRIVSGTENCPVAPADFKCP